MSTDLIERLRKQADTLAAISLMLNTTTQSETLLRAAADEIERLCNSNTALRSAVEALSKELTTEAQSMMRQPEAGVIRSLAERLHKAIFRREYRDNPNRSKT